MDQSLCASLFPHPLLLAVVVVVVVDTHIIQRIVLATEETTVTQWTCAINTVCCSIIDSSTILVSVYYCGVVMLGFWGMIGGCAW